MTTPLRVYLVQCQITVASKPVAFQFGIETAHETIDALIADLSLNSVIGVTRLRTTDDGRGGSMIRSRDRIGLGIAGIVTIQDFPRPVWEPEA